MDKHAVSADRVVNIDETSCRLGPPRREAGPAAAQHEGGHNVHGRPQHGPWPAGHAGADRTRWQDRRRLARAALAGAHPPRHVGERLGHDDDAPAAHIHIGQRAEPEQRRTGEDPPLGHGQHPRQRAAFPHVVLCFLPPQSTSYLQPCDVAVFRSFKSCIQTQASATLARAVLDGSFDGLAMNKAWRRQSSAEWASRAVADILAEGKVWSTGWRQLRAHNDGAFRDAVEEAAALHSRDDLFARHIAPDPAEEGPPMWAMAEETDDEGEDDAPMPDAPPEPELIDMPPAPASAPRMSNLERCVALRLVYGSGPR